MSNSPATSHLTSPNSRPNSRLTSFPMGSTKEIWAISSPLMLSIFSINIMTFLDRLILAQYDYRAMNSAFVAWLSFSVFQYGAIGIASISEVFVGHYNGANQDKTIGKPVWQMIWFSIATLLVFWPMGLFFGDYFVPNIPDIPNTPNPESLNDGLSYFRCLMLFGPAFPMVTALASFFVGRGQVKLVMITTIFSNLINILLDFLLIFGVQGWIPPLGTFGAALATGVAQIIQVLILFWIFLRPHHRLNFGTRFSWPNLALLKKMLKIGLPTSISSIVECSAWSILASILVSKSEAHTTLYSVGDSIFVLMAFSFLGLQKGLTTVVSNLIGSRNEDLIHHTLSSAIKIVILIMLILAIPLILFPNCWIEFFLDSDSIAWLNHDLQQSTIIALRWLWLYLLLDAISWQFSGVLTAAGDTKFVMYMTSLSAWAFSIVPTFICVRIFDGSPATIWMLCAFYGFMNMLFFALRYKRKNMKKGYSIQQFALAGQSSES